jgi:hypothetical protein
MNKTCGPLSKVPTTCQVQFERRRRQTGPQGLNLGRYTDRLDVAQFARGTLIAPSLKFIGGACV